MKKVDEFRFIPILLVATSPFALNFRLVIFVKVPLLLVLRDQAPDRRSICVLAVAWISCLSNIIFSNTEEQTAIVKLQIAKLKEVEACIGGFISQQVNHDISN